jgi:glycosyltransferase involved in cell wall biosynthesis
LVRGAWLLWLLHGLVNRLYQSAKRVVVLSDGMADQVASHRVARRKIDVIPNGTDPQAIRPLPDPKPAGSPVALLYAGAMGPANDIPRLVRSLASLSQRKGLPPWEARLVGGGSEREAVQKAIENAGLPNVTLHPPVPKAEVANLLAWADIGIVHFQAAEALEANSANKWFDLLAAGRPIVQNYRGWQAEVIEINACGDTAPIGDEAAFVEALARMITLSASERQAMGLLGRAVAERDYDRAKLAAQALGVLEAATLP